MARKARVEGDARIDAIADGVLRPKTKREGYLAEERQEARNIFAHHADNLISAFKAYKDAYPVEWERDRLCPFQHGMENMIEALNR